MSKFQEWLKLVDHTNDIRDPTVLSFFIKNQKDILYEAKFIKDVKEYKYMLTFTVDPKKVDSIDQDIIEKYIVKLLNKQENHKFYYSKEHETTNVHWHCIVHRYKRFEQDKLKYYKKEYGHVDISRSFDLSDEHSQKYLGKESKIIKIKE